MRYLFTIALFIHLCLSAKAQDEKIKKELERLSWDWMNGWKAKDTVFLKKILAPEYRLVGIFNGELAAMDRKKWLETVPFYIPKSFRYYNFDIRIYGNTAIVQSLFDLESTFYGKDRNGSFLITDIWVKNKIQWQVVHRHTSFKQQITAPNSDTSNNKQSQDEKEVLHTMVLIGKAWTENNLDTLDKYIDNEYLHTDIRGISLDKKEWFNYIKDRKEKGIINPEIEFKETEIKLYNDLAIVTGINIISGAAYTEKASNDKKTELRFTQVLKKDNNTWKRLRFQATTVMSEK